MKKVPTIQSGDSIIVNIDSDKQKAEVVRVESEYLFAFELNNCARYFRMKMKTIKDDEHFKLRSFVISSIILSYSFLEAAFNECLNINLFKKEVPENIKHLFFVISKEGLVPKDGKNILQQYNMILRILEKNEIAEDALTYQAANVLRILRNVLVHPLPGRVVTFSINQAEDLSEQQSIVKKLNPHLRLSKQATFPSCIYNFECVDWAIKSSENFFREFVNNSGIDPGFRI